MNNLYLEHHGIKGMKWGVRRYQNPDGSLTAAGRKRHGYLELKKNFDSSPKTNDILKKNLQVDPRDIAKLKKALDESHNNKKMQEVSVEFNKRLEKNASDLQKKGMNQWDAYDYAWEKTMKEYKKFARVSEKSDKIYLNAKTAIAKKYVGKYYNKPINDSFYETSFKYGEIVEDYLQDLMNEEYFKKG